MAYPSSLLLASLDSAVVEPLTQLYRGRYSYGVVARVTAGILANGTASLARFKLWLFTESPGMPAHISKHPITAQSRSRLHCHCSAVELFTSGSGKSSARCLLVDQLKRKCWECTMQPTNLLVSRTPGSLASSPCAAGCRQWASAQLGNLPVSTGM